MEDFIKQHRNLGKALIGSNDLTNSCMSYIRDLGEFEKLEDLDLKYNHIKSCSIYLRVLREQIFLVAELIEFIFLKIVIWKS